MTTVEAFVATADPIASRRSGQEDGMAVGLISEAEPSTASITPSGQRVTVAFSKDPVDVATVPDQHHAATASTAPPAPCDTLAYATSTAVNPVPAPVSAVVKSQLPSSIGSLAAVSSLADLPSVLSRKQPCQSVVPPGTASASRSPSSTDRTQSTARAALPKSEPEMIFGNRSKFGRDLSVA